MRCSSIRQNDGDRSQADAEGEETDAEHRPVERNARIWVDGPDGTQRRERGQRHGDGTGEKRAHHDRGEDADKTVSGNRPWSGAQAPQDRGLLLGITKLTGDELKADEQRGQGSNPAEYSEGNGQRLDGSIDLGLDGRDGVKSVGIARRRCCGELPLHLVDVAAPAVESEPVRNGAFSPAGHDLSAQAGSEEDECRISVDVVLDDGIALLHQPHQHGVEADMRWNPRRAEARQALLVRGIDAVRDDLADMHAEQMRR